MGWGGFAADGFHKTRNIRIGKTREGYSSSLRLFPESDSSFQQQITEACPRSIFPTFLLRYSQAGLQQLIRIDVDGDGDVLGEWQFIERFADESAQTHDGFAANQDVKPELAL